MFKLIWAFLFGGTIAEAGHQVELRAKWEKLLKDAKQKQEDLMDRKDREVCRLHQHLNEVDRLMKKIVRTDEAIGQAQGAITEANYMLGLIGKEEPEPLSNTKLRGVTTMT